MSAPAIPRTLVRAVRHGTKNSLAAFDRGQRAGASYRPSSEWSSGRHGSGARKADPRLAYGPPGKQTGSFPILVAAPFRRQFRATEQAAHAKLSGGRMMPSGRLRASSPDASRPHARASRERSCVCRASPIYYAILFFGHFLSDQTSRWLSNDLLVVISKELPRQWCARLCAPHKKTLTYSHLESGIPDQIGRERRGWK
jgi:hypothetical protein